jgi:uncharacterized membrane protein
MGVQEIGCADVGRIVLSRGIVIYVANAVMDVFGEGGGRWLLSVRVLCNVGNFFTV